MYVWFDALSNYITGLDYATGGERYKKYWPANVHVIGKGIIRFHAIYWPAMLLSAGVPAPKKLFVHGYINIQGGKMWKSLGSVIDPFELVKKYGVDPVRYYLLRYIHPVQDSDFSIKKFEDAYTSDLANGLGNLVNRVAGLIEQNNVKIEPASRQVGKSASRQVGKLLENFSFDQALKSIWDKIGRLDLLISEKEPWVLAKEGKTKELEKVLSEATRGILEVTYLLEPFLPETAQKIKDIYSAKDIKKSDALFPRL